MVVLTQVATLIQNMQQEIEALAREEEEAEERARQESMAQQAARMSAAEARGRIIFNALVPSIRLRLCEQWGACEQVKRYEDQTALSMAVGDVLITVASGLPVATISALVVKIGVKKFCNCPSG